MKKVVLVFTVMILIASCKTPFSETNTTTTLFNGKDLSGWTIYGTEKWYVEKGELISENGPDGAFGYLGTDKHYKNFELTLEFKQPLKGNGGVFVRSIINGTDVNGWQVEIGLPGHYTGGIHEYGRGWLVKPDLEKDKALKVRKWNRMKIKVVGAKLTTWLNGVQMATITDKKIGAGEGSIALQINSGKVNKTHWRNIEIKEL